MSRPHAPCLLARQVKQFDRLALSHQTPDKRIAGFGVHGDCAASRLHLRIQPSPYLDSAGFGRK